MVNIFHFGTAQLMCQNKLLGVVGGVLGRLRIADISETIFWKICISDKSVHILKIQSIMFFFLVRKHQYTK